MRDSKFKKVLGVFVLLWAGEVFAESYFSEAEAAPEIDALFHQAGGWIGGDGAYSVALGPERTLWLFSDTWVGGVRDGKRLDATMVNNSAANQVGHGQEAKLEFFVRRDAAGKPLALIAPADGRGWFWIQAGTYVNDRLVLFLAQIDKSEGGGVFGFQQIGQWLGVVKNPLDAPTEWRAEQRQLPFAVFESKHAACYGAAILRHDGQVYVYGWDEDIKPNGKERSMTVARALPTDIEDFSKWRFRTKHGWSASASEAERMVDGMASEFSVSFHDAIDRFVLIYTERGLSPKILARTSETPWGPWSPPVTIYECPEAS